MVVRNNSNNIFLITLSYFDYFGWFSSSIWAALTNDCGREIITQSTKNAWKIQNTKKKKNILNVLLLVYTTDDVPTNTPLCGAFACVIVLFSLNSTQALSVFYILLLIFLFFIWSSTNVRMWLWVLKTILGIVNCYNEGKFWVWNEKFNSLKIWKIHEKKILNQNLVLNLFCVF